MWRAGERGNHGRRPRQRNALRHGGDSAVPVGAGDGERIDARLQFHALQKPAVAEDLRSLAVDCDFIALFSVATDEGLSIFCRANVRLLLRLNDTRLCLEFPVHTGSGYALQSIRPAGNGFVAGLDHLCLSTACAQR